MALSSAARIRWILVIILLAGIAGAWWMRRRPATYPVAYVGDRTAVIWSTTAQVRQTVATLHYGERVAVLRRTAEQSQVRTDDGIQGWLDNRLLMDPALWKKSADLLASVRAMPVQASGRTRAFSNVHLEPGRGTPRIFQFGRNVPVVVFERRTALMSESSPNTSAENGTPGEEATKADQEKSGEDEGKDKKEDWLLVSRAMPQQTVVAAAPPSPDTAPSSVNASPGSQGGSSSPSSASPSSSPSRASSGSGAPDSAAPRAPFSDYASSPSGPVSAGSPENVDTSAGTPIAGWVLARFIELDPPDPIPDYSNAAGMHVVAWVVLNTVADDGGEKPQYLVAGARGGEGQPCDFTLLRAYTWGATRQRYETAYVEDNLCGRLPIQVRETPAGPEFNFQEADQPNTERVYRMRQTIIRRVIEDGTKARKLQRKPQPKAQPRSRAKPRVKSHAASANLPVYGAG